MEEKEWFIRFAINGEGHAVVKAATKEDAKERLFSGPYVEKPELVEWDINPAEWRGGFIDVSEET